MSPSPCALGQAPSVRAARGHERRPVSYPPPSLLLSVFHDNHCVPGPLNIPEPRMQCCAVSLRAFPWEGLPAPLRSPTFPRFSALGAALAFGGMLAPHLRAVSCHPPFSFKHKSFIGNVSGRRHSAQTHTLRLFLFEVCGGRLFLCSFLLTPHSRNPLFPLIAHCY